MIRSRQIAAELGLDMKIGDVEFLTPPLIRWEKTTRCICWDLFRTAAYTAITAIFMRCWSLQSAEVLKTLRYTASLTVVIPIPKAERAILSS